MPAYGSQPLKTLFPGESLVLFDGTETPSVGLASIAFARGTSPGGDEGSTFSLSGMPAGMTIDVQVSAFNNTADFTSVETLTPDANGNAASTDAGRSLFYRLSISAYSTGSMCTGGVQR